MHFSAPDTLSESWASSERFQALVELSPDGILVHDGERIVFANNAIRHMIRGGRRILVGMPIDALFELPLLKAAAWEITGLQRSHQSVPSVADSLKRVDGTVLPVEVRALAFIDHGLPFVHLVIRDISERIAAAEAAKAMEQRLQHAQRMEAVGALAGGVAHEVNNMMAVILGFSEFLLEDGNVSEESVPDVLQITKAATRAASITQQLLAFSRRTTTKPELIDLSDAVTAAILTIRRMFGSTRVVELDAAVHSDVCIDPAQLEQVIVNLSLNARDATDAGDRITVTTGTEALTFGKACADGSIIPAGEYALLSVRDTGIGMDAPTQRRIFEPFFSTKPVGKGTGLGLAAVHGLLSQSGCYINVVSTPGEGAEFIVHIPIHGTKSTNQHDRSESHYVGTVSSPRATILFVDQEASLRILAIRALEEAGFSVVTAANAHEAADLIAQDGPPGLVITDARGAIDSSDLGQQLARQWPALPTVLMVHMPADRYWGNSPVSATATLQKPFTPNQLVSVVVHALAAPGKHNQKMDSV